ncbi:hypothetical protein LINPERHAP1_LOCUS36401 [Linum perenne]
MKRIQSVKS